MPWQARKPPLWDWIGEWNDAVQSIGRANAAKCTRKAAGEMASKLRKLMAVRPGHPDADAFKQRLPYLDAIVQRTDSEGNPIEAALKPVFSDPLLAGVWMLADKGGKRYYLLEDPAAKLNSLATATRFGFEYVVGFDLSKKRTSLPVTDIDAGRVVAPQRETAKALVAILEATNDDSWEPSFCRMVQTVLNDKETEPLLKHFLLRKIVAVGCQGSLCFQNGFAGFAGALKDSKVPRSVNWVDPDNSEAAEQRAAAEVELGSLLPEFADAQNNVAKQWKSLGGAIGTEFVCVGWLRKDTAGNWQCLTKTPCPESGKLVIVRAAQSEGQKQAAAVFEAVGRLDRGKAVIDAAPGPALAEGRPVFVANPPPK